MGIQTIGDAIKTKLGALAGNEPLPLRQIFAPKEIPDSPNLFPCALILPTATPYHSTHGDAFRPNFQILILISKQDAPVALSRLLPLMEPDGASSVKTILEAEPTLGGVVDDIIVLSNSGIGYTQWGFYIYLSTTFEVRIIS